MSGTPDYTSAAIEQLWCDLDAVMHNFTPEARLILTLAKEEARRLNDLCVSTEHLLLGLIKFSEDVSCDILPKLGLDSGMLRQELEIHIGVGQRSKWEGDILYAPRLKEVLVLAGSEARDLNHSSVGPEHILMGLLREGKGVAGLVLKYFGINAAWTRAQLLE